MTSAAMDLIELLEQLRDGMRCMKAYVKRLEDTVVEYKEKELRDELKIAQLEARLAQLHGAAADCADQSGVLT